MAVSGTLILNGLITDMAVQFCELAWMELMISDYGAVDFVSSYTEVGQLQDEFMEQYDCENMWDPLIIKSLLRYSSSS